MSNPAPRIQFNFMEDVTEEDEIPDSVNETIQDIDDDVEQQPLSLPEPVEREVIQQENIFDCPEDKNQLLKELVEKKLPKPKKEPKKKEPKLTKTGKVRKPLSEQQKANLALGRERALETKRRKKIEREEAKSQAKEEAELLKKKKAKDLEKLKKEVEEPDAPAGKQPQPQMFTKKDLEDAQLSAIMSYEKIRAERKKVKQEEQLIQQQKEDIKNKLTKPVGYRSAYNPSNRFYNYY